jgi:hypothetical protein
MKTSLIVAALAAALITGSTASSQAIPAAPLGKSIQQNSSSLIEHVGYRGYRGFRRVGAYRGYRRVGLYRGYRRVGLYRAYRPFGFYGYRGYRRAGLYRGYRWGGVALYRNRGCW